jgi:hypothetical protein
VVGENEKNAAGKGSQRIYEEIGRTMDYDEYAGEQ